jgi:hypothetical protein
MNHDIFEGLPGAELVVRGLSDLAAHRSTPESLLVEIAAPRLARCGVEVPPFPERDEPPEHALYSMLAELDVADVFSSYNALLSRLVSFERSLEMRQYSQRRFPPPR